MTSLDNFFAPKDPLPPWQELPALIAAAYLHRNGGDAESAAADYQRSRERAISELVPDAERPKNPGAAWLSSAFAQLDGDTFNDRSTSEC